MQRKESAHTHTHRPTQMASSLEQIGPHDLVFCSALDNDHTTESCSLPFKKLICQLKNSMRVLVKHNYHVLNHVARKAEERKTSLSWSDWDFPGKSHPTLHLLILFMHVQTSKKESCILQAAYCKKRNIIHTVYLYLPIIKLLSILMNQKRLQESVELLDSFKRGTLPPGVTDAQVKTQKLEMTNSFRIKWW